MKAGSKGFFDCRYRQNRWKAALMKGGRAVISISEIVGDLFRNCPILLFRDTNNVQIYEIILK